MRLRRATRSGDGAQEAGGTLDVLRTFDLRVRPDFRKTIVFGLAALVVLIAGHDVGGVHAASLRVRLIAYGCALMTAVFGVAASRTAAREVQRIAVARAGAVAGTPLRLVVLLGGYLIAAISVCDLVGLQLKQLLVGGAITGIILGLAAQPVLGNLFAGLVLLFARPYVPGQQVRVMSGAINGPHYGVVISAGLLYTTLETDAGMLNIPNSALLAAAVGPTIEKPDPADGPDPDAVEDGVTEEPTVPPVQDGAALVTVIAGAEAGEQRKHSDS